MEKFYASEFIKLGVHLTSDSVCHSAESLGLLLGRVKILADLPVRLLGRVLEYAFRLGECSAQWARPNTRQV